MSQNNVCFVVSFGIVSQNILLFCIWSVGIMSQIIALFLIRTAGISVDLSFKKLQRNDDNSAENPRRANDKCQASLTYTFCLNLKYKQNSCGLNPVKLQFLVRDFCLASCVFRSFNYPNSIWDQRGYIQGILRHTDDVNFSLIMYTNCK